MYGRNNRIFNEIDLGWKFFNSLRTEEDEPIYTYNDKYMRWFVRQSKKGGRVCAFDQYYESKICDGILKLYQKIYVLQEIFMIR